MRLDWPGFKFNKTDKSIWRDKSVRVYIQMDRGNI